MPEYQIDNTETLAHEQRIAQVKQFLVANKTYIARATTTTAQDKAQIKLLSQAVQQLVKHVMNEE